MRLLRKAREVSYSETRSGSCCTSVRRISASMSALVGSVLMRAQILSHLRLKRESPAEMMYRVNEGSEPRAGPRRFLKDSLSTEEAGEAGGATLGEAIEGSERGSDMHI